MSNDFTIVQSATSGWGWGIAILRYSDGTFAVVRYNGRNDFITIDMFGNEADARTRANTEWRLDKKEQMV